MKSKKPEHLKYLSDEKRYNDCQIQCEQKNRAKKRDEGKEAERQVRKAFTPTLSCATTFLLRYNTDLGLTTTRIIKCVCFLYAALNVIKVSALG